MTFFAKTPAFSPVGIPKTVSKPVFRVCDPCGGSAGFIVTAMREVRKHVLKLLGLSEKQRAKLLEEIFVHGFVGCDNSPNMVLLARINMALQRVTRKLGFPRGQLSYHRPSRCRDIRSDRNESALQEGRH